MKLEQSDDTRWEELDYLNSNHQFPEALLARSSSGEPSSGLYSLRHLKTWLRSILRRLILGSYPETQTNYNAHLVRVLNSLAKRIDTTNWRIDDDTKASLCAIEKKTSDSLSALELAVLERITVLEQRVSLQDQSLSVLESVTRGLERIVSSIKQASSRGIEEKDEAGKAERGVVVNDFDYVLLENRFRGSEETVRKRLEMYPEIFLPPTAGPIIEIGAGRGELQLLLKEAGLTSYGLEMDAGMVAIAGQSGADVRLEDGLAHLRSLADASAAGVIAIQLVEHLPIQVLKELLRLCRAKVQLGGRIVFETINTASMAALCSNYFRDPTHAQPLHPETMRFLLETSDLRVLEVRKLAHFPKEAMLQEIPVDPYLTPRMTAVIERMNHNMAQLNELIFDAQDYCIIATVDEV